MKSVWVTMRQTRASSMAFKLDDIRQAVDEVYRSGETYRAEMVPFLQHHGLIRSDRWYVHILTLDGARFRAGLLVLT